MRKIHGNQLSNVKLRSADFFVLEQVFSYRHLKQITQSKSTTNLLFLIFLKGPCKPAYAKVEGPGRKP